MARVGASCVAGRKVALRTLQGSRQGPWTPPDEAAGTRVRRVGLHPLLDRLTDAVVVFDGAGGSFANAAALRLLACEAGWTVDRLASVLGEPASRPAARRCPVNRGIAPSSTFVLDSGRTRNWRCARRPLGHWVLCLAGGAARTRRRPRSRAVPDSPGIGRGGTARVAVAVPRRHFKTRLRLLDVNPAFEAFIGYARDALVGTDPIELQPEEDRAEQLDLRHRLLEDFLTGATSRRCSSAVSSTPAAASAGCARRERLSDERGSGSCT